MCNFTNWICVVLVCLWLPAQAQQKDWARTDRYSEANKEVTKSPKAVLFGDSITDRWYKTDQDFFKSNDFVGRGISGQTTAQMLIRFRCDVLGLKPKYVVILAGTNDIAMNNGWISLENILGNIQSMCELAKAHKIKPIICSLLPAYAYGWRPEVQPAEIIVEFNRMLQEYAKSERIQYVDYHSILKDERNGLPESYAKDGVHPNLECYKVMEECLLKYL